MLRYGLSSEECELLLALERAANLAELARDVGRDPSVLSRQLKRVADRAPVLEKSRNRWQLTELGRQLNRWTSDAIQEQRSLLGRTQQIRLGATRTFAAKAIAPQLGELTRMLPPANFHLVSLDGSPEFALKEGKVDFAFACGRPEDPAIAYRKVTPERSVVVSSKSFATRYRVRKAEDLFRAPHLVFEGPRARYPFREFQERAERVDGTFNDALSLVEAVEAGQGWTILPFYAVRAGITAGRLRIFPELSVAESHYGIWWPRQRRALKPWVDGAARWLVRQEL